eukprot:SAG22_NODE_7_length_40155_cov_25.241356_15_plen_188_part_00
MKPYSFKFLLFTVDVSGDARVPGSASAPQDPPGTSPKSLPDCLGHTSVTERGGEPRPTLAAMQASVPAPGPEALVPQVPHASERKWRDSRYHQWQEDGQSGLNPFAAAGKTGGDDAQPAEPRVRVKSCGPGRLRGAMEPAAAGGSEEAQDGASVVGCDGGVRVDAAGPQLLRDVGAVQPGQKIVSVS